jgi:hypothetical protein
VQLNLLRCCCVEANHFSHFVAPSKCRDSPAVLLPLPTQRHPSLLSNSGTTLEPFVAAVRVLFSNFDYLPLVARDNQALVWRQPLQKRLVSLIRLLHGSSPTAMSLRWFQPTPLSLHL